MSEYPRWLYQAGRDIEWEGRNLAMRLVHSVEEEAKAIEQGWHRVEAILAGVLERAEEKVADEIEAVAKAVRPKRKAK